MFGLLSLLYSAVLFINAIVILNDKRFLNRVCLPLSNDYRNNLSPKLRKIVDFINAIRTVFEIPLIGFNIFFIIYEVLAG